MNLFIFGLGFSGRTIAERRTARGDRVTGTVRTQGKVQALAAADLSARVFGPDGRDSAIDADLANSDALLISVPPGPGGDPVLAAYARQIAAAPKLRWIGYLSTIGVYGDHQGAWVDEQTPATPTNIRSRERADAEQAWLAFGAANNIAVHVFRLAGIYGSGQSPLAQLARGTARRIIKPGQVFNRIHVEDIARVVDASLERPRAGAIYNVTDNEPAPPQDVVTFAASLCGVEPPPEIGLDDAGLTEMGRSFYAESKRVRNDLLRNELGVTLAYPTYREGLKALREADEGPR
ncbi:SDR family oxidoreductase [Afipia massiliensis]|uniref:SDR family oxidoreductase n=1 Tax=Afipia massiliensis TaxID=211460 RepID=A0A4U6BR21_9BRAD|nr:SDR family oxidoreductase [Afipia massiliensis]TKT71448.1 SDR family oxidoreductase [Afipia massiliensis]